MPPLNQQTGLNFARSISFSPDGAFLAMRQEQDWVKLFAIRSAPMRPTPTIRLENWPNSVPTVVAQPAPADGGGRATERGLARGMADNGRHRGRRG